MNIVAMGQSAFLPGFGLAGLRTVEATAATLAARIDEQADAAIIILEEELFMRLPADMRDALETRTRPVVIVMARDPAAEDARVGRMITGIMGIDPSMIVLRGERGASR